MERKESRPVSNQMIMNNQSIEEEYARNRDQRLLEVQSIDNYSQEDLHQDTYKPYVPSKPPKNTDALTYEKYMQMSKDQKGAAK